MKFTLFSYGTSCPAQWSGHDENGRDVYVRYRWGRLAVEIGSITLFRDEIGPPGDGYLDDSGLVYFLGKRGIDCEFVDPDDYAAADSVR